MSLALLIGSIIYFVIFLIVAYFVTDKVVREAEDEITKKEYRK